MQDLGHDLKPQKPDMKKVHNTLRVQRLSNRKILMGLEATIVTIATLATLATTSNTSNTSNIGYHSRQQKSRVGVILRHRE